jgi:hypothetical protein
MQNVPEPAGHGSARSRHEEARWGWRSLPTALRIAVCAFAAHALLLLLDLLIFDGAFAASRPGDRIFPLLRLVACCLFVVGLLRGYARPWVMGAIAFAAFLIRDLVRLGEIFAGPPLDAGQRQLTSALLMSLLAGIGGTWAATLTSLRKARS